MKPIKTYCCILFVLFFFQCGCSLNQKIVYSTSDVTLSKNEKLVSYTVDIQTYQDIRGQNTPNELWLKSDSKNVLINDKKYCINAEAYYEANTVSTQITQMIADHLKAKGTYKDVTMNSKDKADYFITGKLTAFNGKREYSLGATTALAVGSQFGLIGGLISGLSVMSMSSAGTVDIVFNDVTIYRRDGTIVTKLEEVRESFQGNMPVDGHCWSIYRETNNTLKTVIEKLSKSVETALIADVSNDSRSISKAEQLQTPHSTNRADDRNEKKRE